MRGAVCHLGAAVEEILHIMATMPRGARPWDIATVYGVPYAQWVDRRARYTFWLGAEAERL